MISYTCGPSLSGLTIIGLAESWIELKAFIVFAQVRKKKTKQVQRDCSKVCTSSPSRARERTCYWPRLCMSSLRQIVNHPWRAAKKGGAVGARGRSFALTSIQPFLQHWTCREEERESERERGREGRKMQSGHCCAERAAVSEAAVAVCASEMSIKTWLIFRLTEARSDPRRVIGDAAHYAFLRPTSQRTDLSRVSSAYTLVSMIRIWSPLN